jgi:hypothetical protein
MKKQNTIFYITDRSEKKVDGDRKFSGAVAGASAAVPEFVFNVFQKKKLYRPTLFLLLCSNLNLVFNEKP